MSAMLMCDICDAADRNSGGLNWKHIEDAGPTAFTFGERQIEHVCPSCWHAMVEAGQDRLAALIAEMESS
jgi:hypothetical protein